MNLLFFCQAEEEVDGVRIPVLLRGGGGPSHPTNSPPEHWDSTVASLVKSSVVPRCSTAGGDVYVLTGAGRLGADRDGDEECQMKLLWSAVCCSPPGGEAGFSVGFIKETGGGERQVSMKELEEVLGVAELFSEGCGGEEKEMAAISESHHGDELSASVGNTEADDAEAFSENTDSDVEEESKQSREASTTSQQVADAHSETTGVSDVTEETAAETETSGSSSEQQHEVQETDDEEDSDSNSTSTLVFILSTALSILTAPLSPVVSTITELPGQVIYV